MILLLLAVIAGVLALTNPDTETFARRYAAQVNAEVARELGLQGQLGNLLGGATQGVIQRALESQTRREDYLVASVFTVPLPGEDVRALGIAGQFITLSQPTP